MKDSLSILNDALQEAKTTKNLDLIKCLAFLTVFEATNTLGYALDALQSLFDRGLKKTEGIDLVVIDDGYVLNRIRD